MKGLVSTFDIRRQPLDKQVVSITSFPIHADLDPVLLQKPDESLAGELGSLVNIKNT
jgi:hypothetical protein